MLRGKVALSTGFISTRQVKVAYVHRGAVLGLAETVSSGTYQMSALATTNVPVHLIPRTDVLNMITEDSSTGFQVVQMLVGDLNHLTPT